METLKQFKQRHKGCHFWLSDAGIVDGNRCAHIVAYASIEDRFNDSNNELGIDATTVIMEPSIPTVVKSVEQTNMEREARVLIDRALLEKLLNVVRAGYEIADGCCHGIMDQMTVNPTDMSILCNSLDDLLGEDASFGECTDPDSEYCNPEFRDFLTSLRR